MTKVEALKKCRDMWQWLADNPTKNKSEYEFIGVVPQNLCYACEYTGGDRFEIKTVQQCRRCLLLPLWTRSQVIRYAGPCENAKSPYQKWRPAHNPKYAQQIADFCSTELKRMKK